MPTFTISDLAREFELTPRAIRFYEDQGLLAPERTGSGGRQRVYSQRDRTRLKLTLRGKRLGLSLSEVRELVDMYESPSDTVAQLTRFLTVLDRSREALEHKLRDLQETLSEIDAHRQRAQALLDQANASAPPATPPSTRPVASQPG
ncbi:MAG: hypothetical protein RIS35_3089 [Pseudomonadota bacterium]